MTRNSRLRNRLEYVFYLVGLVETDALNGRTGIPRTGLAKRFKVTETTVSGWMRSARKLGVPLIPGKDADPPLKAGRITKALTVTEAERSGLHVARVSLGLSENLAALTAKENLAAHKLKESPQTKALHAFGQNTVHQGKQLPRPRRELTEGS